MASIMGRRRRPPNPNQPVTPMAPLTATGTKTSQPSMTKPLAVNPTQQETVRTGGLTPAIQFAGPTQTPATPTGGLTPASQFGKPPTVTPESGGFGTTPGTPPTQPTIPGSTIIEGPGRGPSATTGGGLERQPAGRGFGTTQPIPGVSPGIPGSTIFEGGGRGPSARGGQPDSDSYYQPGEEGYIEPQEGMNYAGGNPNFDMTGDLARKRAEARNAARTGGAQPVPTNGIINDARMVEGQALNSSLPPTTGRVSQMRPPGSVIDGQGNVYAGRGSAPQINTGSNPQYRNQYVSGINNLAARRPDLVGTYANLLDLPELRDASGKYTGPVDHPEWSTPTGDGFTGQRPDGTFSVNGHQFASNYENDFRGFFNREINAAGTTTRPGTNAPLAPGGPQTNAPGTTTPGTGTTGPGFTGRRPGDIPTGPGFGGVGPIGGGISVRRRPDGTIIPPPRTPGTPGTGEVGGETATWNPTTGIMDRIRGVDPQKIDGSVYTPEEIAEIERAQGAGYKPVGIDASRAPDAAGYTAGGYDAEGYDAERGATEGYDAGGYKATQGETRDYSTTGYEAEGMEAATTKENLSQAATRIANADSPIIQRQRALAEERMNARGLGNSSMAIQAGEAAVLDKATELGAGDVQSEQFNTTSINQAKATSMEARNRAREFEALAKNTANKDNAAEYNRMAAENMRAANDAERFLAESKNRSKEFSAGEKNKMTSLNVTQSNEARRVSSEARNAASAFMAASTNEASKFNTAETNTTGRFNAQLAADAAKFSAEATNQAKQFEAAAKNTASLFNSGEANKRALAAAQFATDASRFAAEMDQASKEFNATAFNQAQQRYADAMNAAVAAQNDAENLSRGDTAQIRASADENNARIRATRDQSERQIVADLEKLGMTLDQRETESIRNLGGQMFGSFQSGLNALMQTEMEPESRQNAVHNYMSVWSASPYLPFDLNMDAFPPSGGAPGPGTPPPGPGNPNTGTPPPPGGTTPGGGPGFRRGPGAPNLQR